MRSSHKLLFSAATKIFLSSSLMPSSPPVITAHTANILGCFIDPFEFTGHYGAEVNAVRNKVFDAAVPREALVKNYTDEELCALLMKKQTQVRNNEQNIGNDDSCNTSDLSAFKQRLLDEAIQRDQCHGPTLSELVPDALVAHLREKVVVISSSDSSSLGGGGGGGGEASFDGFIAFRNCFANHKLFRFLQHLPKGFLSLDKRLKDRATVSGEPFSLPIVGSTGTLCVLDSSSCSSSADSDQRGVSSSSFALKKNLMDELFREDVVALLTASPEKLENNLNNMMTTTTTSNNDGTQKQDRHHSSSNLVDILNMTALRSSAGDEVDLRSLLLPFCSRVGQVIIFWLYQIMNLHLISGFVDEVNQAKRIFESTIGNPSVRAAQTKKKFLDAGSAVVFTQESDAAFVDEMVKDGAFLSVRNQNAKDGTLVFLRRGIWSSPSASASGDDDDCCYRVISGEHELGAPTYAGLRAGAVNMVYARATVTTNEDGHKTCSRRFLLASCHGNSTDPSDGRLQISLVKQVYDKLCKEEEEANSVTSPSSLPPLGLLIGIDANTKSQKDVEHLRRHLQSLGLVATRSVGPTTVKKRMLTAQTSKAGKLAVDEEDFLITTTTLQQQNDDDDDGRDEPFENQTIGFSSQPVNPGRMLPDVDNPSDHYPVGAMLRFS